MVQPKAETSVTRIIYDVASVLGSFTDVSSRLSRVLELLEFILPCDNCALFLAEPGEPRFYFKSLGGSAGAEEVRKALERVVTLIDPNSEPDPTTLWPDTSRLNAWKSHLALPLIGFGRVLGVLAVGSSHPRAYDENHVKVLSVVASQLASYFTVLEMHKQDTAAQDEFLALLVHDLQSPIAVILGNAALLRKGSLSMEEHTVSISEIESAGIRLRRIVSELFHLARQGTGAPAEPLLINEELPKIVSSLGSDLPPLELSIELPQERLCALANDELLARVLYNLLSNAAKYSTGGSRIDVIVQRKGSAIEISVADRGIGIKEDAASRLFEPFYRSEQDAVQKTPGDGMGLTLCKRLIQAQGGTIWAEPREGGGSIFTFTLPVAELDAGHSP